MLVDEKTPLYVLDLVGVSAGEVDGDFLVVGADDQNFAGADVQMERKIGGTVKFHMRFSGEDGFGFGIGKDGKRNNQEGKR
jgi:hypothetical protein